MATVSKSDVVDAVLDKHGTTFAEQLGLDPAANTPANLFGMLVFAILSSTRIKHDLAVAGAQALREKGWTTTQKMADSTWRQRTDTLNKAGYARYDESTSRYLSDTCDLLLDKYSGDLRKLRDEADRDPKRERDLIKECKGIGDAGADIFFREAQASWDEVHPFADKRALAAAKRLDLGADARSLAKFVDGPLEFARLVAGLVRCDLLDAYDSLLDEESESDD
jgi:hypothetical protein